MFTYEAHLHTGEVFTFECDKSLEVLLTELNTCTDGYMLFGEHIRQKNVVIGIDKVVETETIAEGEI